MSDETLPPGWAWATVGEVCELFNGRAFKPTEWTTSGLPIIRIQNLNNEASSFNFYDGPVDERHRVAPGDLLFAWSGTPGTSFGAHVWRGRDAVLNQHIFKVIEHAVVERAFLRLAMNNSLEGLIAVAHGGAGLAHVTRPIFDATRLPIPPLAEQRRIVAALDEALGRVRAARASLDEAPALLERARQAVLAAAFRGEFTEGEAELVPLEELAEIGTGLTKNAVARSGGTSVPLVTVAAVQRMRIDPRGVGEISILSSDGDRGSLQREDVLLVEGNGSRENIGRVAIWRDEVPEARHQNHIFRLRPRGVPSAYLAHWLNSPDGRAALVQGAVSAAGLYTLSVSKLRALTLPRWGDAEQHEIVRRVDAALAKLDAVAAAVEATRAQLDAIERAVLAKAFRGELVPQDAADEPAAAMLARLRETRAATPTKRGRRAAKA